MPGSIVLKIDVDTLRGTQEGAPRLAQLLARLELPATFLFSLGPDHTGRALRRVFRRGFLQKVRRTSVVSNYGLRTLLYGTLLPGPIISQRCRGEMRDIQRMRFEVGVHTHDHVEWQDKVATASPEWTRDQLQRAVQEFQDTFGTPPRVHGAAGWQMNAGVPGLQRELGFEYASDTRGTHPFQPVPDGVPQLPTTLPTLDELIGIDGARAADAVGKLLALTRATPHVNQVFTLHAELEGGAYLPDFERLLLGWRADGHEFITLGKAGERLPHAGLARGRIGAGTVPGRSGELAVQLPA